MSIKKDWRIKFNYNDAMKNISKKIRSTEPITSEELETFEGCIVDYVEDLEETLSKIKIIMQDY